MAVIHSHKKGGKNGKALKASTKRQNGYYSRQAIRTIANRKRKQVKHLKKVEKKALKRVLFSSSKFPTNNPGLIYQGYSFATAALA